MDQYRRTLENLQNRINDLVPSITSNKELAEGAAKLLVSIGMADAALNAYETRQAQFSQGVLSSFSEFDLYFSELNDLCLDFIKQCEK